MTTDCAEAYLTITPQYAMAAIDSMLFYASVNIGSGFLSCHLGLLEFSATLQLYGLPIAGRAHLQLSRGYHAGQVG